MQLFGRVLAVPRIETFVDPETMAGGVHDGVWLVEVTLDDRPVGCILDGLVRLAGSHARRLEALAYRLPTVPTIAVALPTPDGAPPLLDAWMTRWPDPQRDEAGIVVASVEDARDPDNLTRLCAHDQLAGCEVLVVVTTPASTLVTASALARLHARMPEVRPVVLAAEPRDNLARELRAALGHAGGAYLELLREPAGPPRTAVAWRDVELAVTPGPDVELVIHADRLDMREATFVVPRAQELHAGDSLRIDALAPHPDLPAFDVELRCARADLPLVCTALHVARRGGAQAPTHDQAEAAVEANRIVAPTCEPLETPLPHDRWIDGVVVFDVAGVVMRERLAPAMRIELPTAIVDVRVLRGELRVHARYGPVLVDGIPLTGERVIAPYAGVVIDDVRAAFAVAAALPDEEPLRIIEGACTRYPHLLVIDDVPLEVRRRQRDDELWCEGSPLDIVSYENGERVTGGSLDLSWLIHAGRDAPVRGRSRVPIVFAAEHGISATATFDLGTRQATLAVRRVALPSA